MTAMTRHLRRWWGDYELQVGEMGRWRIGPLRLHVHRQMGEWVVAWNAYGDPKDETAEVEIGADPVFPAGGQVSRFVMGQTGPQLTLIPKLADRPVVIKPETPLYIPAGEHVTLYVGSPVWVSIGLNSKPESLLEIEAYRSTDTWAGPNTREGQLCYGSRTLARLRLEDCTIRPHRAITQVQVRNEASDVLLIEQLQLPAPLLALYATEDDKLWTQSVTLVRESAGERARLRIGEISYPGGGVLQRLSEPRSEERENIVFQTFNRLFGGGS